ncbi:MAG: PAS domain S-box protein, partial [Opitutaceae bacterium]|nr:PAS domain S-box protein [Cytophagales bacterium]
QLYFSNNSEYLLSLNDSLLIENTSHSFLDSLGIEQTRIMDEPFLNFISKEGKTEAEKFLKSGKIGEKHDFIWTINQNLNKPLRFKISMRSNDGVILKIEDPGALNNKWGKKLANEQILQLFLNLIPFPLFVKNRLSEYVLLNQAQADLFGLNMTEMIGKSDIALIKDKEQIEIVKKSDEQVFSSQKKTIIKNQQFTTPNGKMYILETTKVPFINDVTGETNILGVSIDQTEKAQNYK